MQSPTDRRQFAKVTLAGAAVAASVQRGSATMKPIPPGIKLGVSAGQPSAAHMKFLKELGVTWLSVGPIQKTADAEGFIKQRE